MSLDRSICAAVALLALALTSAPALAKKAPPAERWPGGHQRGGTPPIKCVERSYSISVGNPAFRHRRWPAPCF